MEVDSSNQQIENNDNENNQVDATASEGTETNQ